MREREKTVAKLHQNTNNRRQKNARDSMEIRFAQSRIARDVRLSDASCEISVFFSRNFPFARAKISRSSLARPLIFLCRRAFCRAARNFGRSGRDLDYTRIFPTKERNQHISRRSCCPAARLLFIFMRKTERYFLRNRFIVPSHRRRSRLLASP